MKEKQTMRIRIVLPLLIAGLTLLIVGAVIALHAPTMLRACGIATLSVTCGAE